MLNVGRSLMSIIGYWILKKRGIRQNSLYPIDLQRIGGRISLQLLTVPENKIGKQNEK
jgi:hypothetical protein